MTDRPQLAALASYVGVLPAYEDIDGIVRHTSDDTYERLLGAMGLDGSTEVAAARTLERIHKAEKGRLLDPTRVVVDKSPRWLSVRWLWDRPTNKASWELEIVEETGTLHRSEGGGRPTAGGYLRVPISIALPYGYHKLRLTLRSGRHRGSAEQLLIVAPSHCPRASELLGQRQALGFLANLYTLRTDENWGVGDLSDLDQLVAWGAELGASFVGSSPLHALRNEGDGISPYSPVSRLFRNIIYLDVTAIPELCHAPETHRYIDSTAVQAAIARLRSQAHIDYAQVMALKRPILEELFVVFLARHEKGDTARGRAYRDYVSGQGEALQDFASFVALGEDFARRGRAGGDWRTWPSSYRNPRSKAVREFRERHRREVEFHCYLQFELDRQLQIVATRSGKLGMTVGLYQDLALGSSPAGSDTWAFPGLFVKDLCVGAPPDRYAAQGQNWGFPPVYPQLLAEGGYQYWIRLVRGALAHAGALRIDHVMGLFRQFWIPDGCTGSEGAYVRYPADGLLAILALESTRAGALVIGEDLGTVPYGLPRVLERWGILSTRVLYFEREKRGGFRAAGKYRKHALVSANTHDMPPLAGFWSGRDLELRRQVDLIDTDEDLAMEREERARDRSLLLRRLRAEGVISQESTEPGERAVRKAVHSFLRRTPSVLVGLSLDDLAGETEPVNLPGVGQDRYTSWSRRMSVSLEDLKRKPEAAEVMGDGLQGTAHGVRRSGKRKRPDS